MHLPASRWLGSQPLLQCESVMAGACTRFQDKLICARCRASRRWLLPVCGRQRLCARLPSPDREAHLAGDFACRSGSSNCPAMPSRTLHGSHGSAQPTGPGTGDSAVVHRTLGVNRCCRSRSRSCHYLQQLSVFPSGGSVAGMDVRQAGEPGTGDGASASGSLSRPATPSDPLSQDALPLDAPERPWACWARWSGGLRAWQGG